MLLLFFIFSIHSVLKNSLVFRHTQGTKHSVSWNLTLGNFIDAGDRGGYLFFIRLFCVQAKGVKHVVIGEY